MEGDDRNTIARIDTLWKPTDRFSARVVLAYTGETANQPANVPLKNNRVCAGDPIPAQYTGKVPGPLCVLQLIGLPVDQNLNFAARGEWKSASQGKGPVGYDFRNYSYETDIAYALSDNWNLRWLFGYNDMWFSKLADHDGEQYTYITNATGGISTERTHELQLAYSGDWLNGTSGFYYYNNKFRRASISWTYSDLLAGTLSAQSAALGGRTPSLNQNEFDNFIKGWAGYSEWTAKLGEFSLTLGGRYTSEKNDTILYPPPKVLQACCERLPPGLTPSGPQLVATRSATFTNFTPRASLQYQWTPDVMSYLTYSKGFNAGGFNTATGVPLPFKPETLDNYELGVKSDLLDHHLRLNVAAFYGIYKDVQIQVLVPFGQTVVLATSNAGEGKVTGFEAQSTWLLSDRVTLNLAFGLLDTKYTDTGGAAGFTKDTPFPFSPKNNYSAGLQYRWTVNKGDDLTLRGDYTYTSRTETNIDPVFTTSWPGYGLLNARLTYQKAGANWSISAFGTNLTDEFYINSGLNITQEGWAFVNAAPPRMWGATFNMKF
jgi:iron complex outermembrane receptor protein